MKTNQVLTTGPTHAAGSGSGIAGTGVGIKATTTATTMASTTATTTATTSVSSSGNAANASLSEEDRRVMDVISDMLLQACMAMFVTSLGLRTVRTNKRTEASTHYIPFSCPELTCPYPVVLQCL